MNKLYFGDNLDVLRDHIDQEFVHLVYLDPPIQLAGKLQGCQSRRGKTDA